MSVVGAPPPGRVTEYCRLCASREPPDSFVSFAATDNDSTAILRAIRRLKPTIVRGDGLPQGVCLLCNSLLGATTTFIEKVDRAQELLARIFSHGSAEEVKVEENFGLTNPYSLEFLNMPAAPLAHSSMQNISDNDQVPLLSLPQKTVSVQAGRLLQNRDSSLPAQLTEDNSGIIGNPVDNLMGENYSKTELPGTSRLINDQAYEMKKELIENFISGRGSDCVESKSLKREPSNEADDSMSSNNSSAESFEESEIHLHTPFPDFTESKNEQTDALAFSNDEMDVKDNVESQSHALNMNECPEVALKNESLEQILWNDAPEHKTPQSSSDISDVRGLRNKRKAKIVASSQISRKEKSLRPNRKGRGKTVRSKRKLPRTSNTSTLPLYNGVPTVVEDLPIEYENANVQRWSDYYFCKRCDINFNTLQNLRQHWWTTHKRCITFKCTMCTVYILNFKRFFRHLINHQKSLEKCCEFCDKCFVSNADVRYHKKLDHPEEDRPHHCGSCGTGFDRAVDLQDHQDDFIVHQARKIGDRRFKCKECGQEFLNKITLVTHMDIHDPTKNVCHLCNKSCTSKYSLKEHIFIVHEGKLQFYCQICGKGFKRKSQLRVHLDAHTGIKRFSCCFCDKKFRAKSQLKSHQPTHSSEKPYICEICNKSYKFKCGLKCHLKTHEEGYVPYACDVCVKTFHSWSNYNKHMKRIHGKDMAKRKNIFKLGSQFSS